MIYNGTTLAGPASLSSTSPTMPSGYSYKRLVGVAVTNSSSQFKVFSQVGNHFVYDEYQQVSTATPAQNWTVQHCASYIPPISTRGCFQIFPSGVTPGATVYAYLRKNGSASTNGYYFGRGENETPEAINDWIDTDSSQQVDLRVVNASGSGTWYLRTLGFEVNLRDRVIGSAPGFDRSNMKGWLDFSRS